MKNRNQTIRGLLYQTSSTAAPQSLSSNAFHFYVNAPPVTKSDFHSYNPWSYSIRDRKDYKGLRLQQYETPPYNWVRLDGYHGDSSDTPWEPTWDRTLVYNMALEKLNSKVRGGLDLSIMLAEARTTARMIGSLRKLTDFARLRRFGSTKDLANGWLQYTYGWKPLMSDIFGIANESVNIVLATIQKVRSRVTLPIEVDFVKGPYQVAGLTAVKTSIRGKGKQSCTIVLELDVPQSSFDVARWTSLNPVSIAWELIPYSFVIDWLYDVGSYLRNLESALYYNTFFRAGYVSELYAYDGRQFVINHKTQFSGYHYILNANAGVRRREFVRAKLTSYPLPRKPTFSVDLNSYRMVSAAALLRQLLK